MPPVTTETTETTETVKQKELQSANRAETEHPAQSANEVRNTGIANPLSDYTAAEYIIAQLAEWGVERIYGVVGDAILYILDALSKQNTIRYIPCRHEGAAALMASAEAKLTGKPGVCMATSGPGIANLLNGVADAAADHVPMLVITGQVDMDKIGTHTKQYVNHQQLISPLAAWSEQAAHPDALPKLLADGLMTAAAYGKVAHLSVPRDLQNKKLKASLLRYPAHLYQTLHTGEETIKAAAEMMSRAQRPMFLAGRGVDAAGEKLVELADALHAGVAVTMPARALFPNDHPLFAGGIGKAGGEAAPALMRECDLIVCFGATWWPGPFMPDAESVSIVHIDKAAAQIGRGRGVSLGVVGDLGEIVPALLESVRQREQPDRSPWRRRVQSKNESWKSRIEAEASSEESPIHPARIMKAVSDHAAEDAIIALDTGEHTLWFDRIFQARRHDIVISGHWRTLGFGIPAAIAAKLTEPGRQVIAIVGDGGVVQTLLELQTAAQEKLPIIVVVFNNGCYAMEKHRMEKAGLGLLGSAIVNPDFAAIADACGCIGMRVETAEQLERALSEAQRDGPTAGKPVLIDVRTAAIEVPSAR